MSSLPENIEKTFKEVFAQVPQKVLWKYEGEMKDKPNNVMIRKWFPQRDILRTISKYFFKTRLNQWVIKKIVIIFYSASQGEIIY